MKLKHILLLAATLASGSAFAQDSGPFVSASVGQGRTSINTLPANYSFNGTSTAWALGGGYRFNQYVGLEAGYRNFGQLESSSPTSKTTTLTTTAWTFGGLVTYPLTAHVDLLARAGGFSWKAKGSDTNELSGTDPYGGIGLSYTVAPKSAISANWTRYKSIDASLSDTNALDIGFQSRF